ncbi:hypothetical protein [Actinomycetospora callitridis]|nr:hypothetical protein [Actinomycetospora callitridis]MDD7918892.1 hypothetical protein [Actinomycetospora callitridis]
MLGADRLPGAAPGELADLVGEWVDAEQAGEEVRLEGHRPEREAIVR